MKNLTWKTMKIFTSYQVFIEGRRTSFDETKTAFWVLIKTNMSFFEFKISIFFQTCMCQNKNSMPSLLITRWICLEKNISTDTLNIYNTSTKEHQEMHSWAQKWTSVLRTLLPNYSEYVSLILLNYKSTKNKFLRLTLSYLLSD